MTPTVAALQNHTHTGRKLGFLLSLLRPQKVKFTGKALAAGIPVRSHPQTPPAESQRPLAGMQAPRKDRQNKPVGRNFREEATGARPPGEPQ